MEGEEVGEKNIRITGKTLSKTLAPRHKSTERWSFSWKIIESTHSSISYHPIQ